MSFELLNFFKVLLILILNSKSPLFEVTTVKLNYLFSFAVLFSVIAAGSGYQLQVNEDAEGMFCIQHFHTWKT